MDASVIVAPGRIVYAHIPPKSIRSFVDSLFPSLAVDPGADSAAGIWHRWIAGHDLAVDVPSVFARKGPSLGLHRLGHILLTDFPTEMGIPIPALSQVGLGQTLADWGIPKGYLNLHLVDGGLGILAVHDGSTDLLAALHGNLPFDPHTCFQTFGEGGLEVALGLGFQNPLFLAGGFEKALAGMVAFVRETSVYVDPADFFGNTLAAGVVAGVLTYLAGSCQNTPSVYANALRGAAVSGLYTISTAFGIGAVVGLLAYRFGALLAASHERKLRLAYAIDTASFTALFRALAEGDTTFADFYEAAATVELLPSSPARLPSEVLGFDDSHPKLPNAAVSTSLDSRPPSLPSRSARFDDSRPPLPYHQSDLPTDPPAV